MLHSVEQIKQKINYYYDNNVVPDFNLIEEVLNAIKSGAIRCVESLHSNYTVNTWVKKAILLDL